MRAVEQRRDQQNEKSKFAACCDLLSFSISYILENICIAQDILGNMNTTQNALRGTGYNVYSFAWMFRPSGVQLIIFPYVVSYLRNVLPPLAAFLGTQPQKENIIIIKPKGTSLAIDTVNSRYVLSVKGRKLFSSLLAEKMEMDGGIVIVFKVVLSIPSYPTSAALCVFT